MKVSTTTNALLVWMADAISSLLNNESEIIGPSKAGDLSILACTSIVVYSALNDSPCWFGTALKVNAVFTLWRQPFYALLVSPSLGIKLWELKGDDELTPGCLSSCGCGLGIAGTIIASLVWGVEPLCLCGNCNLGRENILLHTRS